MNGRRPRTGAGADSFTVARARDDSQLDEESRRRVDITRVLTLPLTYTYSLSAAPSIIPAGVVQPLLISPLIVPLLLSTSFVPQLLPMCFIPLCLLASFYLLSVDTLLFDPACFPVVVRLLFGPISLPFRHSCMLTLLIRRTRLNFVGRRDGIAGFPREVVVVAWNQNIWLLRQHRPPVVIVE